MCFKNSSSVSEERSFKVQHSFNHHLLTPYFVSYVMKDARHAKVNRTHFCPKKFIVQSIGKVTTCHIITLFVGTRGKPSVL